MSQENVQLISAIQPDADVDLVELFGDDEAWDEFAPMYHDEFECAFVGLGQDSREQGVDGLRRMWREWLAPWQSYRADINRVIDCGDDVLVITDDYGRKPGMSAEVRLFGAAVWTVRNGKIAKAYFYADRNAALDAVGLDAAILAGE